MSHSMGWAFARLTLDEQRRRFDFRRTRVCPACVGRGVTRRVLWWRGWRACGACHGWGMLGG
jgi:DnaJ-class molecular chaperone